MQIRIINAREQFDLPSKSGNYNVQSYENNLVLEKTENEIVGIEMNGRYISEQSGPIKRYVIEFDSNNQCSIVLGDGAESYRISISLDNSAVVPQELVENLMHFSNMLEGVFRYGEEYSVEELIDAIKNNQVSLLRVKEPLTGYDNKTLLKNVMEVIPKMMDICSHPKQGLKTEEAILDVNLVKRINSTTMKHLSSHSEHWKSRTLNGLIPNRLKVDIFEDEINIYENLFFRMAVEDVINYIDRQADRLSLVIRQNNNTIDWKEYGDKLNDYKRAKIFTKILPEFDIGNKIGENNKFRELLELWEKCSRQLYTVKSSQFYRNIDKRKHVSRNIHQTNILKNDPRYNALYRLWCEIQKEKNKKSSRKEGVDGDISRYLMNYYVIYTFVLILYAVELMNIPFSPGSKFLIKEDGRVFIAASAEDEMMIFSFQTKTNEHRFAYLEVIIMEKVAFEFDISGCNINEADFAEWSSFVKVNKNMNKIIFNRKPNQDEENAIKKIYQLSKTASKGMSEADIHKTKERDKLWRLRANEIFSSVKLREARVEKLRIVPQLAIIGRDEISVNKFTNQLLENNQEDKVVYLLPISFDSRTYGKIGNPALMRRLLNYGEKYSTIDAQKWGNYRKGILPVSQSEINSVQRIIKLFSIHKAKLMMEWGLAETKCPICGSKSVREDNDTWRCDNLECGVIYGKTRCSNGCGQYFPWIRPSLEIDDCDIKNDSEIETMLSKESIFDRLIITDFEFIKDQNRLKYVPVCPVCGKRRQT